MSRFLLCLVLCLAPLQWSYAQNPNNGVDAKPLTMEQMRESITVPTADLKTAIHPLSKAELEKLAGDWLRTLQNKVTDASRLKLQQPAADDADAVIKRAEDIAKANSDKDAIVLRLNVILDELALKGGDPAEMRTYVDAVSGVEIDLTDTTTAWQVILSWLTSQDGGIRWAWNLGFFLLTLIIFWLIARIIGAGVRRAMGAARGSSELMRSTVVSLSRRAIMLIGIVVAFSMLEVNVGPMLAAIGALGLVLGLALQDSISNFASGLMILFYRPFDVGDAVTVAGETGVVESMSIVSTVIRTFDNQKIMIPNNTVWKGTITNINAKPTRRVDLVFSISYSDDIDKACSILEAMSNDDERVLEQPATLVKVGKLGESSVDLLCRPWVNTSDYWDVYWDLTRKVKQRFDSEGITIPFPQQDVHMHQAQGQGNQMQS